jgi:Insertion element 4 transposase N-terminal/Transposase DDE domain
MSFKLQHIDPESKFCQHLRLPFLETCYPRELVCELLTKCQAWEQRERKLSQLVIVYYVIALSLFRQFNVTEVFAHLSRGLRWLWPDPCITLPTGGALTARRLRLGIVVMRHLFRQCCRPLASPETRGAFAFGLRLMAVDSTLDEVPDTPANALHFGRLTSGKSQSPFPQVRCLYLAEVGTHAIVDAVLARCKASEQALAWVILRSIQAAMLVMTDRNFISVNWLAAVQQRGAQVLCRLAAGYFKERSRTLCDGSYLVTLRRKGQAPLTLRIIEYRLHPLVAHDLALLPVSRTCRRADPCGVHRLVTTLLDPLQAPALELIGLYHERWEIELVIDELKTHQRLSPQPLRSKSPELLYQELYGLLLAHYAVRAWMHQSALQADLDPDRLSFTHALHVLDTACYEFAIVAADELPRLQERLLVDLREPKTLLPARRLRFCPRVVKRAFSSFYRKQDWHLSFQWKGSSFRDILLI